MSILRGIQWDATMMEFQVVRLRHIHWNSNLVHMVELREVPPMGFQEGMVLDKLRVKHCKSHLVQNTEPRWDLPRACNKII